MNGDDQLMGDGEDDVLLDARSDATRGDRIYKDFSKPDEEACRDDGTLKNASEIEWQHSPTASNPRPFDLYPGEENTVLKKRKSPGDEDKSDYENVELPKVKVSCNSLVLWKSESILMNWSSGNYLQSLILMTRPIYRVPNLRGRER